MLSIVGPPEGQSSEPFCGEFLPGSAEQLPGAGQVRDSWRAGLEGSFLLCLSEGICCGTKIYHKEAPHKAAFSLLLISFIYLITKGLYLFSSFLSLMKYLKHIEKCTNNIKFFINSPPRFSFFFSFLSFLSILLFNFYNLFVSPSPPSPPSLSFDNH